MKRQLYTDLSIFIKEIQKESFMLSVQSACTEPKCSIKSFLLNNIFMNFNPLVPGYN